MAGAGVSSLSTGSEKEHFTDRKHEVIGGAGASVLHACDYILRLPHGPVTGLVSSRESVQEKIVLKQVRQPRSRWEVSAMQGEDTGT